MKNPGEIIHCQKLSIVIFFELELGPQSKIPGSMHTPHSKIAAILVLFCLPSNTPLLPPSWTLIQRNFHIFPRTRQGLIYKQTKEHLSGGHFGIRCMKPVLSKQIHVKINKIKLNGKLTRYYNFNSTRLSSSHVLCYTSVVSWVNLLGSVFLQSTATFHTKFLWQRLISTFLPSDGWFWKSIGFLTIHFSFMIEEDVKFGLFKDNCIQICG